MHRYSIVLLLILVFVLSGSAFGQDVGDTIGENIYLPVHHTLPIWRFCVDYNRDNQCNRTEFFWPTKGQAIIITTDLYEFVDIERMGWVRSNFDCRTNPTGCSVQGVRISGLQCWLSEPTAVDEVYIEIPMQEVPFDECRLEIP